PLMQARLPIQQPPLRGHTHLSGGLRAMHLGNCASSMACRHSVPSCLFAWTGLARTVPLKGSSPSGISTSYPLLRPKLRSSYITIFTRHFASLTELEHENFVSKPNVGCVACNCISRIRAQPSGGRDRVS